MRKTMCVGGLIVLAIGCGDDNEVSIGANKDNVCAEIAEVACHNMFRCCSESEIENFLGVSDPRTEIECGHDVQRLCDRQIAFADLAIKENRARFDSQIMNNCLEALVAPGDTCVSVDAMLPWADACMNSAWVGLVAVGGTCLSQFECAAATDNFCASNQKCTARPTSGQSCQQNQVCASGLFCDNSTASPTCKPLLGTGSPCSTGLECQKGLFCDFRAQPSVCTPLHDPGQACTGNNACSSAQCLPGTCAQGGNTCFADTDCSSRCADDNSFCTQDGDCAAGTCSMTATTCFSPTGCTGVGNTCVFPVKCNPGDCTGDIVCADRHVVVDYCQGALNDLPLP